MQIKEVQISNILSIEDATVKFGTEGLVLVDGWNFDDNRANGAGKTAIFNALSFALYGQVPRKITVSQILRRGAKAGYASASVETAGGTYSVTRSRPAAVEYRLNGEVIDITQEEFERYIGLNYEQFQIAMYSAQPGLHESKKFLEQNDRNKKEFILSLMNLNFFRNCEKEANVDAKKLEAEIQQKKIELQGHIAKIQAYTESLVDEDAVKSEIRVHQEEIEGYKKQIIRDSVDRPDLSKFDEIEQKIHEKRAKFNQIRQQIAILRNEYDQKKRLDVPYVPRQPDASCPECGTHLSVTGTNVTRHTDESAILARHEEQRKVLQNDMQSIAQEINRLDDDLAAEQEIDKLVSQIKQKKHDSLSAYESYQRHRFQLENAISQREQKIRTLEDAATKSKELSSNIQILKGKAKECTEIIQEHIKEVELLKAAASVFSPTGAPAYIMDSVVDSFNDCVSKYVQLIWPNASYSLQTYKENKKDKTQKAQFSEQLEIAGKEVSIGSLSGGEARALSIAVDFAIIDILSQNFSIQINPVVLDEPFDGLDSVGRETVVDLLENLSIDRQIWVIDHASESKAMFSQVLRVEKHGGVTKVVS